MACSTSFSINAGDADDPAVSTVSTALRIDASSDGSCSSTYSATWLSVTRRRIGITIQTAMSARTTTSAATRKPMMALAEKRSASMPSADPRSTMAVPPSTRAPPRRASFIRQRRRTSLITAVSCARGSFPELIVAIVSPSPGLKTRGSYRTPNAGRCESRFAITLSATSNRNPISSRNHQMD